MFTGSPRGYSLFLWFLFVSQVSFCQVYFENFTGEADGATSGTAIGGTWTTTLPSGGAGSFSRFNVGAPYGGIFRINNTVTEGVWRSNSINISTLGEVALEVLMGGNDATAADYVRAYYVLDGGPEVLFAQVVGQTGLIVFTAASAVVSGSTLQIVIRGRDNSGGAGLMGFDDVTVTDIEVLYSRASTAFNVGTTWSLVGLGGASCGCTPNADRRVVIGHDVTFTADGTAAGLEVRSGGTLRWTATTLDLTIARGGAVDIQNGGTLTRNGFGTSTLQFANYTYSVNVAGSVDIGALIFTGSGSTTINNTGSITLASTPGLTINTSNGYVINNSGTLNLTSMDLNNNDITLNNSGTINQTGTFTDVDAGSTFNNLAGATWNYSGTGAVTNVRLFANNNSNTFNYGGAAQAMIVPQDAYSNLTLSGSGAKTIASNFAVNGNWTRSGSATFTAGTIRVTFSGNIPQTLDAPGLETFANLTINNSSADSPQITFNDPVTVSTNLTMLDGNVDLNGNAFTLSSPLSTALTHSQLPTAGWMYGGSITRNYPTTAVANDNVAGYYPLGSATESRPFLVSKSNTASSNGTITIAYTDAETASDVNFLDGGVTVERRHDSFWTLTKTGVTAGTFRISLGGTGFTIALVTHTRLTRVSDVIGTAVASTGSPTDVRAHRSVSAAQLVNNWYLASTNGVPTPLPIQLAYFRARIDEDEVLTLWKTVQEKNNDYFTVQKTTDFETFYDVGEVAGQGTSSEEKTYSVRDNAPLLGKSYYRLKQTDYDGKTSFSDPVLIDYAGPTFPFVKVFPNPLKGKVLSIEVKGIRNLHVVPVQLYNLQGQKILDITIEEIAPGLFKKQVDLENNLTPGLYLLRAGPSLQLVSKVIID